MSRTYRKTDPRYSNHFCVDWIYRHGCIYRKDRVYTKKEKAMRKADGQPHACQVPTKWYMNQISRKYRATDRREQYKIYTMFTSNDIDYLDDIDYDLSNARAYQKGIWWQIY